MKTLLGIQNLVTDELVLPDVPLPNGAWTPETFEAFCLVNPGLRCELDPHGRIVLMSPTNSNAGHKNLLVSAQVYLWLKRNRDFIGFDSSTGFTLPNDSVRSPDTTVLRRADWDALTADEQNGFAPALPVFVIEIRSSSSDSLDAAQAKMEEYMSCGVELAWLIDPVTRTLHVVQPEAAPVLHSAPPTFSADPVLPGFVLDFEDIWPVAE